MLGTSKVWNPWRCRQNLQVACQAKKVAGNCKNSRFYIFFSCFVLKMMTTFEIASNFCGALTQLDGLHNSYLISLNIIVVLPTPSVCNILGIILMGAMRSVHSFSLSNFDLCCPFGYPWKPRNWYSPVKLHYHHWCTANIPQTLVCAHVH
jgi:hypothetical protein